MAFNPINWLLGLFSLDIAIDLGTANTLVHVRGKGIVINEPSWVTIDKRLRQPIAIGLEAKEMVGRTPSNVIAVRPLRDGVISEFNVTQQMLDYFIGKVHEQSVVPLPRPRVVVGIPTGVTEVEKRAVYDAVMTAGARQAFLIEEPIAAALGAGLPVGEIRGSMVVDIGGGTTEVAVMSSSRSSSTNRTSLRVLTVIAFSCPTARSVSSARWWVKTPSTSKSTSASGVRISWLMLWNSFSREAWASSRRATVPVSSSRAWVNAAVRSATRRSRFNW